MCCTVKQVMKKINGEEIPVVLPAQHDGVDTNSDMSDEEEVTVSN